MAFWCAVCDAPSQDGGCQSPSAGEDDVAVRVLTGDKEIVITSDGSFYHVMSVLSDLLVVGPILIIVLLVITVVIHLLPWLILVALVFFVVWFLFFRNPRRPVAY